MIGITLDEKYRIVRPLGAGGMGSVFEAEHEATGRRVAVKVIDARYATNESVLARFQREARAAGAVDSQHVAQVLDAGVDRQRGIPFLVMEFLAGEDVSRLLKRVGPLAPALALRIVAQACIGLSKAHAASIVHRDIKPANLFLARSDAGQVIVKVLDFGIAKMAPTRGAESAGLTQTGNMLGSPLYMSPEQVRESRAIDHRTDLWSMGVVLYQALSGVTPFDDVAHSFGEVILAICGRPPAPLRTLVASVPEAIAALAHRALQQNPDARFQSADEMLSAIEPFLPQGFSLHECMFVHGGNENASTSHSRAALLGTPEPPPPSQTSNSAPAASQKTDATVQPLVQSGSVGPTPRPLRRSWAIAAGAAFVAVGAGAPLLARTTPPVLKTAKSGIPVPSRIPEPPPRPAPPPSATAEPPMLRTEHITIVPKDAAVQVEGKPVATPGGALEITGKLGSTHHVRVAKGKIEKNVDVIITENGPNHKTIELVTSSTAAPRPPGNRPPIPDFPKGTK